MTSRTAPNPFPDDGVTHVNWSQAMTDPAVVVFLGNAAFRLDAPGPKLERRERAIARALLTTGLGVLDDMETP